jgi:hypothetical protein
VKLKKRGAIGFKKSILIFRSPVVARSDGDPAIQGVVIATRLRLIPIGQGGVLAGKDTTRWR